MKIKIIVSLIIIVISILHANDKKESIMESREYLKPIIWPFNLDKHLTYNKIIRGAIEHPLQIGVTAITYFFEGITLKEKDYVKRGEDLLSILDNYPYKKESNNSIIYLYNQNHGSMKAKEWWSGMANSSIALAYLYGYKATGHIKYKISAIKALNGVILPIKDNGSAVKLDENATWYLEYANDKSNIENSKFVLNGFQYSLLVLKIFQEEFKNPIYTESYEKGIQAFKKFSKQFYYPNDIWTYYMLNPLTIESVHYAIYDSMLISSLLLYDKKNMAFLQNELLKRKKILRAHYNVEKYSDGSILFSAIGVPHPYWIDVYPTELNLYYKSGLIEKISIVPKNFKQKITERAFIYINHDKSNKIDTIEIFQKYNNRNNKLFETRIDDLKPIMINTEFKETQNKIPSKKSYYFDLFQDQNRTYIRLDGKQPSRGMIRYQLNCPVDLWDKKFFYIYIKNSTDINNLKVVLIDTNGETSERYYLPLKKGKNLVLLSAIGFRNQNINHSVKEVRFYVYIKNNKTIHSTPISFSELYFLDNNYQLYSLMKNNDDANQTLFKFQEKKPKTYN